jgi:hypothetical protein
VLACGAAPFRARREELEAHEAPHHCEVRHPADEEQAEAHRVSRGRLYLNLCLIQMAVLDKSLCVVAFEMLESVSQGMQIYWLDSAGTLESPKVQRDCAEALLRTALELPMCHTGAA